MSIGVYIYAHFSKMITEVILFKYFKAINKGRERERERERRLVLIR